MLSSRLQAVNTGYGIFLNLTKLPGTKTQRSGSQWGPGQFVRTAVFGSSPWIAVKITNDNEQNMILDNSSRNDFHGQVMGVQRVSGNEYNPGLGMCNRRRTHSGQSLSHDDLTKTVLNYFSLLWESSTPGHRELFLLPFAEGILNCPCFLMIHRD